MATQPGSKRIAKAMAAVNCHSRVIKFITALRAAVENGGGCLDKEATSRDDLFDAFRI